MGRVQSSIHGPTIVLQPASPAAESGRRRSSLIFTPCASETPTRPKSLLKLQQAASSFCSVTGWDFSPVVEDDVAQNLQAVFANNFKTSQRRFSSSCWNLLETGNCGCYDTTETDSLENVSCFVSCSSPMHNLCPYADQETASPHAPARAYSNCITAHPIENAAARRCSEDHHGTGRLEANKWLGAALANQAELPSPPSPPFTSFISTSSPHSPLVQDKMNDTLTCSHWAATSDGMDSSTVGTDGHGAGEAQKRGRLRRTLRVVRDMNLMSATA